MDLLSVAREYFQALGIQFFVFSDASPGSCPEQLDYRLRQQLFPGFDYQKLLEPAREQLKDGVLYQLTDEFHLHYAVLRLPEPAASRTGIRVLAAGPVMFQPLQLRDFLALMDRFHISPELQPDLQEFYN